MVVVMMSSVIVVKKYQASGDILEGQLQEARQVQDIYILCANDSS